MEKFKLDKILHEKCDYCGKEFEIRVNSEDFEKYTHGVLIQRALPYLTAEEREIIMNNICTDCWDEMMIDWDYVRPLFYKVYRLKLEGKVNLNENSTQVSESLDMDFDDYELILEKMNLMIKHFSDEFEFKQLTAEFEVKPN